MVISIADRHTRPVGSAWTRTAAWLAIAALGDFALAAAIAGFVTPGYDARRETISALAALDAPYAWVMMIGFAMAGLGLLAVATLLWHRVPLRTGRVAAAMVGLAGLLVAFAGVVRQDCSEQLASCRDFGDAPGASADFWVHQYVSMAAFALLILASLVLASGLRRCGHGSLAAVGRLVGAARLVAVALLVVEPPVVTDNYGLVQRLFVTLLLGWPLLVAVRLPEPSPAHLAGEPVLNPNRKES